MSRWLSIKNITCLAAVWLLFATALPAQDQQGNEEGTEVYLTFQYRGVVSTYVTSYYKDGQFYLPVSELFNQLQIQHEIDQGTLSISGNYLGKTPYLFDFNNRIARAGDTEIELTADDFLIKEIDYFVRPAIYEELFGLNFSTDFNNLTLDLETEDKMPVFAQYERKQNRERIDQQQLNFERDFYPLQYDRQHRMLDGTFLDYNLTGVYSNDSQLFNFNNALGLEIFGGDVQGNIFGSLSDKQQMITTSGLRWRYVQRNNNYFSSGILGQTHTEGISNRPVTGVKISNKPVEPRRLFDRYVIDGNVEPRSEVELYLNNRLIDYQEADESGNYRFVIPLRYGSTEYSLQIYKPSGESVERNSRIQIPFDYVPTGKIDYSISSGQLDNPILGSTERGYVGSAAISAGVADWLTTQVSTEYLSAYHESVPSVTGTLNARLLSKYLISANANSDNFYRLSSSVVYSGGTSWSLSYDYNPGDSRLYNTGGNDHQARVNLFTPFQIGSFPLNIRWSTSYEQSGSNQLLRYRADLNTRLGRLNVRFGYRDQQITPINFNATTNSRITNSYTYSMGRFNDIPQLFRGLFIRGQASYLPGMEQLEEAEIQLSRDLLDTGRMQVTFGRNFLGDFNTLSLAFTVDFNNIRSNTTSRATGSQYSVTQSLRGSANYDPKADQILFKNRQQVGQAGAAVRLFVDNDNDGEYTADTDDIINDPAVRLGRAGGQVNIKNGVNYISQLLPYQRYNLEVKKGALSNPLLVPDIENFSIVTDPNQYKTIEVPFYLSGVISGRVDRKQNGELSGVGGLRLFLESRDDKNALRESYSKEIRTFSDGSYYQHEVPPGKYNLYIDPSQLEFLNAVSEPDTMQIEVESKAEGDFVEDLNFVITPKADKPKQKKDTLSINQEVTKDELTDEELYYQIQLASFKTLKKAKQVALTASRRLESSFTVIENTRNGLFAIRGNPTGNRDTAIETVISYHNSAYESAALVLINNSKKESTGPDGKFIQLGAFSTQERAEKFAAQRINDLGTELAITYHQADDLYKVYVDEQFPSDQQRSQQLKKLKSNYSFSNAFINENNQIQIGAFISKERANAFVDISRKTLKVPVSTFYDPDEEYHNVYVDENYNSQSALQSSLAKIRNTPSVFEDAFVSAYSVSKTKQEWKQRPMQFTYQVQVKGVSKASENKFLSSILSKTDITVKRPKEGTITFDHVSTWDEAQELQRTLSKVSNIGHPVIILIEATEN